MFFPTASVGLKGELKASTTGAPQARAHSSVFINATA